MKLHIRVGGLLLALLAMSPLALCQQKTTAQTPPAKPAAKAPMKAPTSAEDKNIQEYVELIRSNVRQEKAQIMGSVMQLNASDAAKFWDIYSEYDEQLSKLNKLRSDNIIEFAKAYDQMTDARADELMKTAIEYQKQRNDLLVGTYQKVREAIGGIQAARFVQVENQLLHIIDLQIASNLPLVEGGK